MFAFQLNPQTVQYSLDNLQKVGTVKAIGGSKAPDGWLFCDGAAISRTTYAALFAIIGTTYGAGNGTTTFNLPNMRLHGGTLAVSVYGNGKSIGITDGYSTLYSARSGVASAQNWSYVTTNGNVGTTDGTAGSIATAKTRFGLSTSASLSGLEGSATINNSTQTMKLIIKY
jgi:microcystin-dependent protein